MVSDLETRLDRAFKRSDRKSMSKKKTETESTAATVEKPGNWGLKDGDVVKCICPEGVTDELCPVCVGGCAAGSIFYSTVSASALAPAQPSVDLMALASITSGTHELPLSTIAIAKNPRALFDDAALEDLAAAMAEHGQEQAVTVYRLDEPDAEGHLFVLIAGERRCRAAAINKWTAIRAEIRPKIDEDTAYIRRVVENALRVDLTPMEKAKAYAEVLRICNKDVKLACVKVGLRRKEHKGEEGVRVFHQTMQFATSLIPAAMDALAKERITPAHAALLCRVKDGAKQKLALEACFRSAPINNGATHENEEVLISEKELRGWINTHIREEEENQQGRLFENRAKDKNDLDREQQQNLESEGTQLLEGSEGQMDGEPGEGTQLGGFTSEGAKCEVCGADATHRTSEDTPVCNTCDPQHGQQSSTESPKAKDDDEPEAAGEPAGDYDKQKQERVERLEAALSGLTISAYDKEFMAACALAMCPAMVDPELFARLYGQPVKFLKGNLICFFPSAVLTPLDAGEYASYCMPKHLTIRQFIEWAAYTYPKGERFAPNQCEILRRIMAVLLALPAVNPSYPEEFIVGLENRKAKTPPAKKTEPAKKPKLAKPISKRVGLLGSADKVSGKEMQKAIRDAKKSKLKPTPKKKASKR